ncbi:PREDICTED: chymotrypsin-2-like isoform X2 [Atta cephalotes]|uniref:chymotrypsin n=2 Tax=Atta TaxID=12956 RepID=A0A158P3L4_ATTCE|nr:PREDICTED: chymotrypsin-2-like isoform X2 [Atta cephalotes]KYM93148.1 Chymotrypsin-1 [Atta colombica]
MLSILYILSIIANIYELSADESVEPIPKIVGGKLADEGQFPYQASLRLNNQHFCGGSVISERYILTAAHCCSGLDNTVITVVLGTNTLDKGGDQYFSIKKWIHPYYNSVFIWHDIALIKVNKDIVFGDKVKPIALPTKNFDKSDYPVILSGWGTTSYPGKTPNDLQYIQLRVINQKQCAASSFRITKNNICTLNKWGEGACHGDSGGPLVAGNEQIGVVSWGIPCAKNQPDVYTRVYAYMPWIDKCIQQDKSI